MALTIDCKFSITYLIVWTYMLLKFQTSSSSGKKSGEFTRYPPPPLSLCFRVGGAVCLQTAQRGHVTPEQPNQL